MTEFIPVSLSRTSEGLSIAWSDGSLRTYRASELRAACPCATCREKHGASSDTASEDPIAVKKPIALPVLSLAEAQPLVIESMRPVGNYAYNIAFSDGHDSGIFTFEFLATLGKSASPEGTK